MEQDFNVGRLRDRHELSVLVPDAQDRRLAHDVIYLLAREQSALISHQHRLVTC